MLNDVQPATATPGDRLEFARYLARHPRDNRLKLFVTLESLAFRRDLGLGQGSLLYVPLEVIGPRAEHWVAFAWHRSTDGKEQCEGIVMTPRFVQLLENSQLELCEQVGRRAGVLNGSDWRETYLQLVAPPARSLEHAFTHIPLQLEANNRVALSQLVSDFPLVILS